MNSPIQEATRHTKETLWMLSKDTISPAGTRTSLFYIDIFIFAHVFKHLHDLMLSNNPPWYSTSTSILEFYINKSQFPESISKAFHILSQWAFTALAVLSRGWSDPWCSFSSLFHRWRLSTFVTGPGWDVFLNREVSEKLRLFKLHREEDNEHVVDCEICSYSHRSLSTWGVRKSSFLEVFFSDPSRKEGAISGCIWVLPRSKD